MAEGHGRSEETAVDRFLSITSHETYRLILENSSVTLSEAHQPDQISRFSSALPRCESVHRDFPLTMEVNFRKIDIDQYEEDVLLEGELYEPDPRDPAQVLNDTKQKGSAVRGSLSKYVCLLCSICRC